MITRLSNLGPQPTKALVHVVVESPRGATSKLKYDPELGTFTLSRPLPLGLFYPFDWGFVPGTRAEDGDPLDALLLSEGDSYPGMVVRAKPLAVIQLEQNAAKGGRERNDRIITVPEKAPRGQFRNAADLSGRFRAEIERFFVNVTHFEKKDVKILRWGSASQALALVKRSALSHPS
jgi:inorganic pyrophosphatase